MNTISGSVFRTNHVEDYVVDQNSGLTADELRLAHGKELFKNNQFLVHTTHCPVLSFLDVGYLLYCSIFSPLIVFTFSHLILFAHIITYNRNLINITR